MTVKRAAVQEQVEAGILTQEEAELKIQQMLEQTAQMLKQDVVTRLQRFKDAWRRQVLWLEGVILTVMLCPTPLRGPIWKYPPLIVSLILLELLPVNVTLPICSISHSPSVR